MHSGHHRRHAQGKKELLGFVDGARESAHDWRALLLDLKRRGLSMEPKVAVADGALGFWKAIGEVWSRTREQRCWVHKTANILNKLPKSQQPRAKRMLQDIWMAETRKDAEAAFDAFDETYAVKYEKTAECLKKGARSSPTQATFNPKPPPPDPSGHHQKSAIARLALGGRFLDRGQDRVHGSDTA